MTLPDGPGVLGVLLQNLLHLVVVFSHGVGEPGSPLTDEQFTLGQGVVLSRKYPRQFLKYLELFPGDIRPRAPEPVDRVTLCAKKKIIFVQFQSFFECKIIVWPGEISRYGGFGLFQLIWF